MSRYDLIDSPDMMEIGLMFNDPAFAERFISELAKPQAASEERAGAPETSTGIAA